MSADTNPDKGIHALSYFSTNGRGGYIASIWTENQKPVSNVHRYSLSSQLFSDETDKLRFVYVPEGKKVGYVKNKVFIFPVGSVLIKTFAYLNNNGPLEAELLETRLLINTNNGWKAISYVWNEDQTDAKRAIAGATIPTRFVNSSGKIRDVRYRAPNQNQCKECHQLKKVMTPIGPKARNMNKLVEYDAGEMNQLVYWAALGWINENLGSTSISNYADVNAVFVSTRHNTHYPITIECLRKRKNVYVLKIGKENVCGFYVGY